uniref:PH domain-containing protein n=1 Tax=Elaeophora elaphi TaxID=1147741 RepID=A0A0R3RKX2_9BILA
MPISDALTILSCASTYKIRLELERAIINDAIQTDCPENVEQQEISTNSLQQSSTLYKSYSTSDLALRLQKAQMSDKAVSGGSFMSKQKYQLPRQTVINTIKEEAQSITPETLSPSSPSSDFTEKTEFAPIMMESVISEETIIISDPLPVLKSLRTSPSEISPKLSQNRPYVITSETCPKSTNYMSNSIPSNVSQQQQTLQIPTSCSNEHSVLSLIPEENHQVDEIDYNGFSEFVERSRFMYSNASIKDDMRKNCVEFCELIEPKRDSIVIEFEENQIDDCYQQSDEEMIGSSNCNGTFDEVKSNLRHTNSGDIIETPPTITTSNSTRITANHIGKDRAAKIISDLVTDTERSTWHHPAMKTEGSDDRSRRNDIIEDKSDKLSANIQSANNLEQNASIIPSVIVNHTEINESNGKHMLEDATSVAESPAIPHRKMTSDDASANDSNQRSAKCNQLGKLSGNGGINEVTAVKEVRKLNGTTADELKDEGNNRSNIPLRSPKWSPKLQSHIPVITRTPSAKSKNKLPKVEGNKIMSSSAYNKTTDDTMKNDMNGASLYIAKKEALRKTYLPFSKTNKSEEVDLNKERKARLEANQALLQRQQDELRTLGILP